MKFATEYNALVTNLLTLTGLEEGRTNAAYLRVDQQSFPKEYEDYFNEKRQQSGVGVLDLAGCYLSEKCQVIIFERVIADLASRLNIELAAVRAIVLCHEVAHMVTHLGGGHGVAYWQKFSQASSNQTEFYAQIYTHFLIAHESPNLVPKMEALARNSPAVYQSYLTVLPACPLDLINGNLYQDRGGERLSLVFSDNFTNTFQTGLNQLHTKIETDEPLETTFFQTQFTPDAHRHLMVGDSIVSWEMLERLKRAKDG